MYFLIHVLYDKLMVQQMKYIILLCKFYIYSLQLICAIQLYETNWFLIKFKYIIIEITMLLISVTKHQLQFLLILPCNIYNHLTFEHICKSSNIIPVLDNNLSYYPYNNMTINATTAI